MSRPVTYLTTAEVCAILRVSRITLWKWRSEDKFPAPESLVLPGGHHRWDARDVERVLDTWKRRAA